MVGPSGPESPLRHTFKTSKFRESSDSELQIGLSLRVRELSCPVSCPPQRLSPLPPLSVPSRATAVPVLALCAGPRIGWSVICSAEPAHTTLQPIAVGWTTLSWHLEDAVLLADLRALFIDPTHLKGQGPRLLQPGKCVIHTAGPQPC